MVRGGLAGFFRIAGFVLLALTVAAAAWEAVHYAGTGELALRPLGEWWYLLDPGSLNLMQAVIQRYVLPELWDPVAIFVLAKPAVVALGLKGALLLALGYALKPR